MAKKIYFLKESKQNHIAPSGGRNDGGGEAGLCKRGDVELLHHYDVCRMNLQHPTVKSGQVSCNQAASGLI